MKALLKSKAGWGILLMTLLGNISAQSVWIKQNSGTTANLTSVVWAGSRLMAFGVGGTNVTSLNGTNWAAHNLDSVNTIQTAVWTGTQLAVAGYVYYNLEGKSWTFENNDAWVSQGSITGVPYSIVWTGSQYFAATIRGSGVIRTNILSSPDLVTWTEINTEFGSLPALVWTGAQLVSVGDIGHGEIRTSPDGVTWTERISNVGPRLKSLAWTGTQIVAVGDSGRILTSPNGADWTIQNSGVTISLNSVAWTGNQLLVTGSSGTILTSSDGINWTSWYSGTTANLTSSASTGTQFIVVGQSGIILTSPDDANITPIPAPGAPTSVTAIPGNGYVQISWSPSTCNNCGAATSYTATANPGGQSCSSTTGMSCSISGLSVGNVAYFTVVASNSAGDSPASASAFIEGPIDNFPVPGTPTDVTAVAGNGHASVSWSAGTCNSCWAATSYTVTSNPGGKTCFAYGTTTCSVVALTNGTAYTFTVIGINSIGSSASSAPSAAVTPMALPDESGLFSVTGVIATAGNSQAAVSWTAPTSSGGNPITGYVVTSNPDGKTCATTGALTCTVTGLTNGTTYTFSVVVLTSAGAGISSPPSLAVMPKGPPGAPTAVTVTQGNGQAMVSWTAPVSNGGSPITKYTATAVTDTTKRCTTTGAPSCVVTGLVSTAHYTFLVTATNAVGTGAATVDNFDPTPLNPSPRSSNILSLHLISSQLFATIPASFLGSTTRAAIYDLNGNKVRKVNAVNSATGIVMPLGKLTNGIYLFELQTDDKRMTRTFSLIR